MIHLLLDVQKFHEITDTPVSLLPSLPSAEARQLRIDLLTEEYNEYKAAEAENDLVEIADGLADMMYIICGTALHYGIPLDRVWDEVQRSNMAKLGPNGKVVKRPDGKIMKPEGWTPPDIAGILKSAEDYSQLAIWTNNSDFVIAKSAFDAIQVCKETGMTWNQDDIDDMVWEKWPDSKPFPFHDEATGDRTQLPALWVREVGRGYFASADV